MSTFEERRKRNEGADDALLMKPVDTRKRSLASLLSLDHDSEEDALVDTQPSKQPNNISSSNSNSNKRRKILSIDSKWELKEIPELPFLYLKEKTSVVVMNDDPQQIASRIVQCAKKLNAHGQYCTKKAKATLTIDEMSFSIQLFKVSEKSNNCVIVEMQRTSGSSIQFHKTARALLRVAKEKGHSSTPTNKTSSCSNTNSNLVQSQTGGKEKEKLEVVFTHTLDVVDALLKKDRVDANLLGMESLQLLTSHQSSSDTMVQFASDVVVTGEQFEDIKDTIVSVIEDQSDQDEERSNAEDDYCRKIHTCALSILSNSLRNVANNNDAVQSLGEHLFSSLLGKLKRANVTPKNAYLACKCLEEFFLKSADMRNRGLEIDVYNIIINSQRIGKASYPLLGSVSERVLQILGEVKEMNTK